MLQYIIYQRKRCYRKQDGCSEINKLFLTKQKVIVIPLALDDYFFAFCISLPSKYPAPPHNPISAINASYDKVIIGKISFLNYGTITIYIDWACTPRLERTVLPFLVASVMILLLMEYFVKHMFYI
uniref:Uncharacterized protein n=1 Tax=Siphoviridae sp. cttFh17 TaxID=2826491 RepID=A0A8S5NI74_9CAUD|nr:MAG TPA: hypothetical protein [Siphoviridae sp. cttFh17]